MPLTAGRGPAPGRQARADDLYWCRIMMPCHALIGMRSMLSWNNFLDIQDGGSWRSGRIWATCARTRCRRADRRGAIEYFLDTDGESRADLPRSHGAPGHRGRLIILAVANKNDCSLRPLGLRRVIALHYQAAQRCGTAVRDPRHASVFRDHRQPPWYMPHSPASRGSRGDSGSLRRIASISPAARVTGERIRTARQRS